MIIRIMYISCKKGMMKALKKNQIVIFAIALMLITAGYLNYTMQTEQTAQTSGTINNEEMAGIGDAKLVSTDLNNAIPQNNVEQKNDVANTTNSTVNTDNKSKTENSVNQSSDVKNQTNTTEETTTTSAKETTDTEKYFAESKLERENMYSEMLESYQSILASTNVSAEQKSTSQKEISTINSQKNAIMIAENLIKNKGFKDVVIFVNNDSISVVVKAEKLQESDIAQIQSIVQRELNAKVENIHISNK